MKKYIQHKLTLPTLVTGNNTTIKQILWSRIVIDTWVKSLDRTRFSLYKSLRKEVYKYDE